MAITAAQINEIKVKVDCHDDKIRDQGNDLAEVKTKVDIHDKWINGNGTPGAKTTLALLSERWDRTEKKIDGMTTAIWGLVVVVLTANVALLGYLIQMHIK
jgi:hypothetical protein